MSGLQELAVQWLTGLGSLLPFGFAFGAGVVAAVNPCGFAMLPAYLSLYLGNQEAGFEKRSPLGRLGLWREARDLDPDNWIIRKQIWSVEHLELFYPRIDKAMT